MSTSLNLTKSSAAIFKTVVNDDDSPKVKTSENKAFYLGGLNGLRAIAAACVIACHVVRAYGATFLDELGGFGVSMFFALSGFLITLLLLKEIEKTDTIKISKFYTRRILRIWPLYFLYMVIVLVVITLLKVQTLQISQVLCYIFFLPNVPMILSNVITSLGHYWSLGVEEQFYFFWPFAIKRFYSKLPRFFILFIALFLVLKVVIFEKYGSHSVAYFAIFLCRFDCMAIGGFAAYMYFKKPAFIAYVNKIWVQALAWLCMLLVFFEKFHVAFIIDNELIAFVTTLIIINQISPSKKIINLENKPLNFLGKISYGTYVFHPLVMQLLVISYAHYSLSLRGFGYILFPVEVVALTYFLAHISYKYFESKFLLIKDKFATVHSTNTHSLSV